MNADRLFMLWITTAAHLSAFWQFSFCSPVSWTVGTAHFVRSAHG